MTVACVVGMSSTGGSAQGDAAEVRSPFVVMGASNRGSYAVVSAIDVALHCVALPVRTESQARQAAPFAIEDEVAADLADTHIAVGQETYSGARIIAVASKAKMDEWIAAFTAPDEDRKLVPETSALGAANSLPVVVDRREHVILAFPDGVGFAVEEDLFPRIAGPLLVERDTEKLCIYSDRPDRILPKALPPKCEVDVQPPLSDVHYAAIVAEGAIKADLSLLQGPYAPRTPWSTALKNWSAVFAVTAILLVSYGLRIASDGVYYARAADDYLARTEAIARQALPDVQRIINPRTQVLARLNGLGDSSQSSFLPMASALYEALDTTAGSRLEALMFDQARGMLSATVSMVSYQDIDTLRANLARRGFKLEEGGSRTSGTRVVSELRVTL